MARRRYRYRNRPINRGHQRRRRNRRDEGLGGILVFGALFAWVKLGIVWTISLLVIAAVLIAVIVVLRKRQREQPLLASGIADIDQLNGRQFEKRLAAHFRRQGYQVDLTPYQGDFGADLIIERDGVPTAIQAKRWKEYVGVGAVQEIVSAKAYYQCQHAMVVTNSAFTQAARQLAASNEVTLWDRRALIRELATPPMGGQPIRDQQLQW
jgi:restriction system protein